MLTGENDILTQANKAKRETENAQQKGEGYYYAKFRFVLYVIMII